MADRVAAKGKINGIFWCDVIGPESCLCLLYTIPLTLALYYGIGYVDGVINFFKGGRVLAVLGAVGGMLPALGIAMNMKAIFKGDARLFFFLGFLLTIYLKLNLIAIGCFAVIAALLYVSLKSKEQRAESREERAENSEQGTVDDNGALCANDAKNSAIEASYAVKKISRRAQWKSFLIFQTFGQCCYNYERFQGIAFLHSMCPIIDEVYAKNDSEGRIRAMTRHLAFFNTQPSIGGSICGLCASLEERIAAGQTELTDTVASVKNGLMGPLGGVGDTITQGILLPLLVSLVLGMGQSGNTIAPWIFVLVYMLVNYPLGWWCWKLGYRKGSEAIVSFLESGVINKVIVGAGIMGCMVMGALAAGFVNFNVTIGGTLAGGSFDVQKNFFDAIMPKILPLLLTLATYKLLKVPKLNALWVLCILAATGILLGAIGII
jgi:PTS system mannose-specific IID component